MKKTHFIEWGVIEKDESPSMKEIDQTIFHIRELAKSSNSFSISVTEQMYKYLEENLENAYIKLIGSCSRLPQSHQIIIGTDKETVDAYTSRI